MELLALSTFFTIIIYIAGHKGEKDEKERVRRKRPDRQIYRPGMNRFRSRHTDGASGELDNDSLAGGGDDSSPESLNTQDRGSSTEKEVDEIINRIYGTQPSTGNKPEKSNQNADINKEQEAKGASGGKQTEHADATDRGKKDTSDPSGSSKRKHKRPDMQIYVPKGRQQVIQEEYSPGEEGAHQNREENEDEMLAAGLQRKVDLRSNSASMTVTVVNSDLPPPAPGRDRGRFLDRMVDSETGWQPQKDNERGGGRQPENGTRRQQQAERGGLRGRDSRRGRGRGRGRGHMRSLSGGSDASHDSLEWDYQGDVDITGDYIGTEIYTNSKFEQELSHLRLQDSNDKQQQKSRKDRRNRNTQEEDRGGDLDRLPPSGRGRGREMSADRMSNASNDSRRVGTPKQRRRDRERRHSMDELEERLKSPKSGRRRRQSGEHLEERLRSPKPPRRQDRRSSRDELDEHNEQPKPQRNRRERRHSGREEKKGERKDERWNRRDERQEQRDEPHRKEKGHQDRNNRRDQESKEREEHGNKNKNKDLRRENSNSNREDESNGFFMRETGTHLNWGEEMEEEEERQQREQERKQKEQQERKQREKEQREKERREKELREKLETRRKTPLSG